jgi:2-C-methyl-D-erythritol 4-phosphate cytidylyltransferase
MPQAVPRDLLERAFAHAERAQLAAQTVWELLLAAGIELAVVPGEECNIKITTAQDWAIAQRVIAPQHIDGARSP